MIILSTSESKGDIQRAYTSTFKAHSEVVAYLTRSPVAAQVAVNTKLEELTGVKLDRRVLQRAFARTRFTTALDLEALKEYAALNVEAGYARSAPDLAPFIRK